MLRAEWSSPTNVPYSPRSEPVDNSLIDLWLVLPDGDSVRYEPTPVLGDLAATATPAEGEKFSLSGTIAGHAVRAVVRIPGRLIVDQPAGDTLRLALGPNYPRIPFAWSADEAASYQAMLVRGDGTRQAAFIISEQNGVETVLDIAPDTTGDLMLFAESPATRDTARVVILGYDPAVTAFFSSSTKGNVHGTFGIFGGAAKAEIVVLWE